MANNFYIVPPRLIVGSLQGNNYVTSLNNFRGDVNIVTESCYLEDEIHITEKSMKPFYFYQFPLFLASYGHVKHLKERFGFDVFDDILNHSYDESTVKYETVFVPVISVILNVVPPCT